MTGADERIRALAISYLDTYGPLRGRPVTAKVRSALRQSLGTGDTTVEAIARLLALSPRSLQRHLSGEGTSFAAELDAVRRERARALLITTDMPMGQISSMLGLGDPATLSRYARRWWGSTARALRADASSR